MLKIVYIITFLLFTSLSASTINVAVAANVSYAIDDLIKAFNETHPNTKVRVTLGSSGKLTAQIKHGAPYDIFMSANMKFPQSLHQDNLTLTKPTIYAKGSLAMLSSKPQDFSLGLTLLTQPHIKRIAIANAKTAPYGQAAKEALEKEKIYQAIQKKLIFAESISQTLSYTIKASDIGLVATSTLYGNKLKAFKKGVHWIEIPKHLYTPINQGIVLLKQSKKEAKTFYEFMLSQKAQIILQNYGYQLP